MLRRQKHTSPEKHLHLKEWELDSKGIILFYPVENKQICTDVNTTASATSDQLYKKQHWKFVFLQVWYLLRQGHAGWSLPRWQTRCGVRCFPEELDLQWRPRFWLWSHTNWMQWHHHGAASTAVYTGHVSIGLYYLSVYYDLFGPSEMLRQLFAFSYRCKLGVRSLQKRKEQGLIKITTE